MNKFDSYLCMMYQFFLLICAKNMINKKCKLVERKRNWNLDSIYTFCYEFMWCELRQHRRRL